MPLNIRNEEVNKLAEKLAARKHISKTEAVRLALLKELRLTNEETPVLDRIKIIQDRLAAHPNRDGVIIDKAFFDELSGDY